MIHHPSCPARRNARPCICPTRMPATGRADWRDYAATALAATAAGMVAVLAATIVFLSIDSYTDDFSDALDQATTSEVGR